MDPIPSVSVTCPPRRQRILHGLMRIGQFAVHMDRVMHKWTNPKIANMFLTAICDCCVIFVVVLNRTNRINQSERRIARMVYTHCLV